ncbi:alpha-tocopherol transfer protein-like [Bacillus rossius redtenbacheri]|uniref:alpha-tocopherol transfer protein-like n=1 Tax=Bacillus rossius redtenbacheri TaxID=93214 RepID=UPI002FDE6F01
MKAYQSNAKLKEEDVENLKEWLIKQYHLPAISEKKMIMFLHACDYMMEATKRTIDSHYTIKTQFPELWSDMDPMLPELQRAMQVMQCAQMPSRDARGHLVLVMRLSDADASRYSHVEVAKTQVMLMELVLWLHGPFCPGLVVVVDEKLSTFGHAARTSMSALRKHFTFLKEGFPGKIVGFHVINCVSIAEKVVSLIKPFVKIDLLDKLKFHRGGLDSLYKYIPQEILPFEYGGNAGSFEDLHKKTMEVMMQHRDWFLEEEKLRVDESKRTSMDKNSKTKSVISGSFKKLDID